MDLAVEDRVCVRGKDSTVFIIKRFRTVEQAECVRADGKVAALRYFSVDKLERPEPEPRKWKKANKGGGMYESNDDWIVVKTSGGWFAQHGKVMSEVLPMKKDAYAWVDRYKVT